MATSNTKTQHRHPTSTMGTAAKSSIDHSAAAEKLMPSTLFRLTDGLPITELQQMVSEAKECEAALEADIALLEKAKKNSATPGGNMNEQERVALDRLLGYELTPPDRFFTISALMGRLRDPLAPPLPPNSTIAAARRAAQQVPKKKKSTTPTGNTTPTNHHLMDEESRTVERYHQLLALDSHPEYWRKHTDSTQLLAVWKRLSSHRTAAVFRRPVNPKEAPGYTDRILFPIDLSLIRKMIIASLIQSWADLQMRLQQICHNCVKFNGRVSDYAIVTRDFEAHTEEVLLHLIYNSTNTSAVAAAAAAGTKAAAATTKGNSATKAATANAKVVATNTKSAAANTKSAGTKMASSKSTAAAKAAAANLKTTATKASGTKSAVAAAKAAAATTKAVAAAKATAAAKTAAAIKTAAAAKAAAAIPKVPTISATSKPIPKKSATTAAAVAAKKEAAAAAAAAAAAR